MVEQEEEDTPQNRVKHIFETMDTVSIIDRHVSMVCVIVYTGSRWKIK